MASSRWKRFAFFDRSTLNLPAQVLEDLIPSLINESGRRISSLNDVREQQQVAPKICMVINTASLPTSIGIENAKISNRSNSESDGDATSQQPLTAMWSSLTACSGQQAPLVGDAVVGSAVTASGQQQHKFARLPSQSMSTSKAISTTHSLALLWVTSPSSPYIHCFDLTLRCNGILENDSDGWRGYYMYEGIIDSEGILDMATTRIPDPNHQDGPLHVTCLTLCEIIIYVDPHLHLSCRLPITTPTTRPQSMKMTLPVSQYGKATTMDMEPGRIAIGTDTGHVLLMDYSNETLIQLTQVISHQSTPVTSIQLHPDHAVFVSYHKGICCFEIGGKAVTARHDLDGRSNTIQGDSLERKTKYMVARPDGLYVYGKKQKHQVSPIDGSKNAICAIETNKGSSYALVASTDSKSGRDAVDIYDATNKLVAFHVLLSPGHKALRAVGITRQNCSSAVIFSSGGSIVTLTEKTVEEKISLLVQKNLYAAAISMAYADPSYLPSDITALYKRHAEHLYRKGDYSAAMDQYIYTIGSLESAHVIFRYLDAPKIVMLARYLEELRARDMATPVHNELLRTCYLKLNDNEAAEKIAASASRSTDTASIVSSLAHNPKEALASVCSLQAPQAAEALVVHGAALARALPRETAGVVVSLCIGTYSSDALQEASGETAAKMLEFGSSGGSTPRACTPYPVHLFASAFVESPKVLRLILAHCSRNKCFLTPSLRRTLLELTLAEWNDAKRTGDTEAEKLRRKEAITVLTDAHCRDIGDYDALVLVQLAGFSEGELLLFERLQMTPMLLARYAQDGGDRARRHMLAMCRTDPEVLADVLGHFVTIASQHVHQNDNEDENSLQSDEEEILDDIREALALARAQGVLPPVRIARILAGEGAGQFSVNAGKNTGAQTVPLSVALDYVGAILDDSRVEISRLKAEVEEYNQLCNSMEAEVNSLLSGTSPTSLESTKSSSNRMNIEELHSKLKSSLEDTTHSENKSVQSREAFWREMNQSEDRFDTIARFFAKNVIQ